MNQDLISKIEKFCDRAGHLSHQTAARSLFNDIKSSVSQDEIHELQIAWDQAIMGGGRHFLETSGKKILQRLKTT